MKRVLVCLSCILFCFGCSSNEQSKHLHRSDSLSKANLSPNTQIQISPDWTLDTSYDDQKIIRIDTVRYLKTRPQIKKLPFGYDFDKSGFANWNTLGYKESKGFYKLPQIVKVEYTNVNWLDTGVCKDGSLLIQHIKLDKYQYRLPDVNGYQCYYWYESGAHFSPALKRQCDCFLVEGYGYLIFYQPATRLAKVVTVLFDLYEDGSDCDRFFYIDKNYIIHLAESCVNGDDEEPDPMPDSEVYTVDLLKLSPNGSLIKTHVK